MMRSFKLLGIVVTMLAVSSLTDLFGQTMDTVCFNTAPNAFVSSAAATGGDTPYTYLWQDSIAGGTWAAAPGTNNALTFQPPALSETTYYRREVSSASCGTAYSNTLMVLGLADFDTTSTSVTNVSCNSGSDGSVTVNVTGGLAPYTYLWSNGGSTGSLTSLSAGTYTVTITDDFGCGTLIHSFTVTEPAQLVSAGVVDSNITCNGLSDGGATGSATGGTMPYTYTWSNSATTASITGVVAGTYSVTITDQNGCTDSSSVTITEPAILVSATVLDSNVTCNSLSDGGATSSATGGTMPYTYAWSNGATTASITGVVAGTYSVTITDQNGCTDSSSVIITEPALLVSGASVDSNVTCNTFLDGGATAFATGGTTAYTYLWSNTATTASITGVGAGTYTVTITDANGCTDSSSVTITEPAALIAAGVVDSNITCNGLSDGGATGSATGGTMPYTYAWSNSATTASITGVTSGTYSVTITDANGCTDSASVTITQPAVLIAASVVDSNVSCNSLSDGGATGSATGGTMPYTYAWSNSATTASITGVVAGTYSVTITDANGCTDSASVTITQPAVLVAASVVDSNVSCNSLSDGGATSSATGGTMPYTYAWSNGATTASITGVVAGTYSITITDQNGCTDSASVIITQPDLLVTSINLDSAISCYEAMDGGLTAMGVGGTTAYSYLWNNGATTATLTGLDTGAYSVTITDANGCTDVASTSLSQPDSITISLSTTNVTCNGGTDGEVSSAVNGGTPTYTYLWSTSETTTLISGLSAGTYTLTVTDLNGCVKTASSTVTEPLPLGGGTISTGN